MGPYQYDPLSQEFFEGGAVADDSFAADPSRSKIAAAGTAARGDDGRKPAAMRNAPRASVNVGRAATGGAPIARVVPTVPLISARNGRVRSTTAGNARVGVDMLSELILEQILASSGAYITAGTGGTGSPFTLVDFAPEGQSVQIDVGEIAVAPHDGVILADISVAMAADAATPAASATLAILSAMPSAPPALPYDPLLYTGTTAESRTEHSTFEVELDQTSRVTRVPLILHRRSGAYVLPSAVGAFPQKISAGIVGLHLKAADTGVVVKVTFGSINDVLTESLVEELGIPTLIPRA